MLPDYLFMTYLKISRNFGVEAKKVVKESMNFEFDKHNTLSNYRFSVGIIYNKTILITNYNWCFSLLIFSFSCLLLLSCSYRKPLLIR